ncbi:MAG: DUF3788 domain-containing protein [Clostridia bacterium]|nr:DUF3788 domain-containing protein [Clostridia bacterium]
MALSIFGDKAVMPNDLKIAEALGNTYVLWNCVKDYVNSNNLPTTEEWKYYGKSSGWTLLLKHKKRTMLYLFPGEAFFIVLFVFGDKAINYAKDSGLPDYIIEKMEKATPYLEGRSFQIEVRNEQDLQHIKMLSDIKMRR